MSTVSSIRSSPQETLKRVADSSFIQGPLYREPYSSAEDMVGNRRPISGLGKANLGIQEAVNLRIKLLGLGRVRRGEVCTHLKPTRSGRFTAMRRGARNSRRSNRSDLHRRRSGSGCGHLRAEGLTTCPTYVVTSYLNHDNIPYLSFHSTTAISFYVGIFSCVLFSGISSHRFHKGHYSKVCESRALVC